MRRPPGGGGSREDNGPSEMPKERKRGWGGGAHAPFEYSKAYELVGTRRGEDTFAVEIYQ